MINLFLAGLAGGIGGCATLAIFIFGDSEYVDNKMKDSSKLKRLLRSKIAWLFATIFLIVIVPTLIVYIFKWNDYFGFAGEISGETKVLNTGVVSEISGATDELNTGVVGDTFGGITAPFIGTLVAILTFLAFYVQFKANEQQKNDLKVERFENKFYHMLELHKANINEMSIGNIEGRKCFVNMFYELKIIYELINSKFLIEDINIVKNLEYDKMSLAYNIFFFGVGENSEKQYSGNLSDGDRNFFDAIIEDLRVTQNDYRDKKKTKFTYRNIGETNEIEIFKIKPYNGHANILGHYYRHLNQMVKFVHAHDYIEDRYSYMKIIRAQLSNFEQLMLYYNALAWFDKLWSFYFVEYRFIKNIPLQLADFHINPEMKYMDDVKRLAESRIKLFENQLTPLKE